MIRVIIVGAGSQHHIGIPAANSRMICCRTSSVGSNSPSWLSEHVIRRAQPARRFFSLGKAARGERSAFHLLVAGVAIGNRNELYRVSHGREQRRRSGCTDIAVVRMRPERDHAKFGSLCWHHQDCTYETNKQSQHSLLHLSGNSQR